ncbi:two-component sensor histidine kinase [Gracilibacillus halophilus YIM-C55.5]|uniref:histidine kinase n=2 Tax=Gracilibacillus TaxID=74385 RepID=N4WFK8_9BACI|nr:two-component sensor histidine kinase [Gracilibacillus halophilus YIM-C55.5]
MKIRTKLLLYFAAVIVLVVLMFFVREQSVQRLMDLRDESTDYNFLLNEITDVTDQTYQSLQIYVHEPIEENVTYYREDKQELKELQQRFEERTQMTIDRKNYIHLLSSFLELADQTVEGVKQDHIEQYSRHLSEANDTATYIHEKTLELINQDLTAYQKLISLEDQKVKHTKNMSTTIFISIMLASILFALWFSNSITRPIDRLTHAAKELSAGNYSGEDVETSQRNELWILTHTFNEMKHSIRQSVKEVKEKARLSQLVKEMELRSLQNQINPHFLFNTLNTISKTAYIEDAERTSHLISSVSRLLRYNIGSLDRETYIKDEVDIVNEYFFIQQTRFGDRVTFHQQVDEDCLYTPIPCLTLQPIVENAFMHGIEEMSEGAEITLNITQDQRNVWIEIRDNGVGMEQDTLNRLMNERSDGTSEATERKGHSTGIGIRNVIDRLELFDKQSNVTIQSTVGQGTTVLIRLRKERDHGESDVGR